MTFLIRPANMGDLQPIYEMAKRTGGGFTNLPPDKKALSAKLERSAAGFDRVGDDVADDLYVFVLQNSLTGEVRGTCQIFGKVGQRWPFYSYRIGALTQHSVELERTFRADILNLSTDLGRHHGSRRLVPAPRRTRWRAWHADCAQPLSFHSQPPPKVRRQNYCRIARRD